MSNPFYPPINIQDFHNKSWLRWFRSIGKAVEGSNATGSSINNVVANSGENLNVTSGGKLVIMSCATSSCTVTLPKATNENIGAVVKVTIIDATFNGFVVPKSGETIIDQTSVTFNQVDMSLSFTVRDLGRWVIV